MMRKPGEPYETTDTPLIEVSRLGSGWAAVHTVNVETHGPNGARLGHYRDVQQTGIGRYRTREEAVTEARIWSASDDIPLASDIAAVPASHPVSRQTLRKANGTAKYRVTSDLIGNGFMIWTPDVAPLWHNHSGKPFTTIDDAVAFAHDEAKRQRLQAM